MISLCARGMHRFHFHSASSPPRQPNVTLTGRAAGYSAVILATGLQGGRQKEMERRGEQKDGVAGAVPVFSLPPLSLPSAFAPGWKNQAHRSVRLLMLYAFHFLLTFTTFSYNTINY